MLRTDPYLANGYFMVDQAKYQALRLDHIDVDIIVATPRADAPAHTDTVQSFTITNGAYGKADLAFLNGMLPNQSSYYHLTGVTATGSTPVSFLAGCTGREPWPEVCRQTCLSNSYAWAIKAHAFNGEAYMEMADGLVNGSYDYFYVKASDWQAFKQLYTPSQLGLTNGTEWGDFLPPYPLSTQVFSVTPDGGYIFAGGTTSNDGDVSVQHGQGDAWVVKLGPDYTGTGEPATGLELSIFPNPATTAAIFACTLPLGGAVDLAVLNAQGQLVMEVFNGHAAPGPGQWHINLTDLTPGEYFLRLVSAGHTMTRKLVRH